MLIENLIRLGRPLLAGGRSAEELIKQITDVATDEGSRFFAHVLVVEIDRGSGEFRAEALPVQEWGIYEAVSERSRKRVFRADQSLVAGAPFVRPMGGNPVLAHGSYGVPTYPAYERSLKAIWEASSAEKATELTRQFLSARLKKTPGLTLEPAELDLVSSKLSSAITSAGKRRSADDGFSALIILAEPSESGPFVRVNAVPEPGSGLVNLGRSVLQPGTYLATKLDRVAEHFWAAKISEGAEGGTRKGPGAVCSVCGKSGYVVSAYCKGWPLLSHTWEAPFSAAWCKGKDGSPKKNMVRGIALCDDCYKALTFGASVFFKLATRLETWLVKELFSPAASPAGKETARASGRTQGMMGSVIAVPVVDTFVEDPTGQSVFVDAVSELLHQRAEEADTREEAHLRTITGLELYLPRTLTQDDFRLMLLYYSGAAERGDIHLRALISDVMPSTATLLTRLVHTVARGVPELARAVRGRELSDRERAFLLSRFRSLPYLLGTAYGGQYLWTSLSKALHRGPFSRSRFVMNSALRMSAAARRAAGHTSTSEQEARSQLQDEVVFYLCFREFLSRYARTISWSKEGAADTMRDWRQLVDMMSSCPPTEMRFGDAEELGFACGYLTGEFSRSYWGKTKSSDGQGKDFLKHRVMTFGTDLAPDALYSRGLIRIEEVARRLDIPLSEDFRLRLGVVLASYIRDREQIARDRHSFMAAFWSGYELSGAERARSGATTRDREDQERSE